MWGTPPPPHVGHPPMCIVHTPPPPFKGRNFRQKSNSEEDGIDGTNGFFPTEFRLYRRTENLGIPFRTLPRKRKQLGIPFRGTKIEVNFHNSVLNPSAEENTTRNSVPWNQNRCKFLEFRFEPFHGRERNSDFLSEQQKIEINSRNSVPKHSVEEKPTQNKMRLPNILITVSEKTTFDVQTNHFVKLFCCCFVKLIFLRGIPFRSVPSFGIGSSADLGMPRNECFLPRINGNRGIFSE